MTKKEKTELIDKAAVTVIRECNKRNYNYPSAVLAQMILESGFTSKLATQYNNWFGLKCGKAWKGTGVNLKTSECYDGKSYVSITDCFRVYDSMDAGIVGYFDFIAATRYSNLHQAVSYSDYIVKIGNDGYYTAPIYDYVDNKGKKQKGYLTKCQEIVEEYDLQKYDEQISGKLYLGTYQVTCSSLRIRTEPKLTAGQVGSLLKGTKIAPIEKKSDLEGNIWYRTGKGWSCGLFHGIEYLKKI